VYANFKRGEGMSYHKRMKIMVIQETMKSTINALRNTCIGVAKDSGWFQSDTVDIPKCLLMIHAEISEAAEGHRKDLMDEHLPNRKMLEVELADAVIRIMSLSGALKLDVGGAVVEKLIYNIDRQDHKPENKAKPGGKKY